MKYKVGDRVKFVDGAVICSPLRRKIEKGVVVKKDFKFFGNSKYYIKLDNKENLVIISKKNIIGNCLPSLKRKIPMPECSEPKENKIEELYKWLKGERRGYLLEDNKTWINYGDLNDKFPYDENEKQRELSINHMIEKTLRKMKGLGLVIEEKDESK